MAILITLGCSEKKHVKTEPEKRVHELENPFKMSLYQKVDRFYDQKDYRFICVEIIDTTGKDPIIASGDYFIRISDSTKYYKAILVHLDPSGIYNGLFPVDIVDELVSIDFGYSIITWATFEDIDIQKELIPLDTTKYDASAPLATMEEWYVKER